MKGSVGILLLQLHEHKCCWQIQFLAACCFLILRSARTLVPDNAKKMHTTSETEVTREHRSSKYI